MEKGRRQRRGEMATRPFILLGLALQRRCDFVREEPDKVSIPDTLSMYPTNFYHFTTINAPEHAFFKVFTWVQ
jgi:hypothetical protein